LAAFLEVGESAWWTERTVEMVNLGIGGVANMAEKLLVWTWVLFNDGVDALLLFEAILYFLELIQSLLEVLFLGSINGSLKPYLPHPLSLLLVFLLHHFFNFSIAIEEDTHGGEQLVDLLVLTLHYRYFASQEDGLQFVNRPQRRIQLLLVQRRFLRLGLFFILLLLG
jgi:hypothetical protein